MSNFFGSSTGGGASSETEIGSRLYHIKESAIGSEAILSILPDDNVVVNNCTNFGKSLLNVSSLNGLVGLINTADTKVEVIDSGTGEINFTLDNALKLTVMNDYTQVLNELISLNIVPATNNTYNLGSSSNKWANVHATTFTGNLTGNSSGNHTGSISGAITGSASSITLYNSSANSETRGISTTVLTNEICGLSGPGTDAGQLRLSAGGNYSSLNKTWIDMFGYGNRYMIFGTSNNERMRIDTNGNVGIGTTSPATTLQVSGTTSLFTGSSGNSVLQLGVGTGVQNDQNWISYAHGTTNFTSANERCRLGCQVDSNGGGNFFITTGLSGAQTERMRITSGGNVAINNQTQAPKTNLHLYATGSGNTTPSASGITNTDLYGFAITGKPLSRIVMETLDNTTGKRVSVLQNSSNSFSIGSINNTATVWNKEKILACDLGTYETTFGGKILPDTNNSLDIGSTTAKWANVHSTTFTGNLTGNSSGTHSGSISGAITGSSSSITLFNGSLNNETREISTTVLTNEICGLSGPGTDAGQLRLSAGGNSNVANKSWIDMYGFANRYIAMGIGSAERMRIDESGNVGIGMTSAGEKLEVNGSAKFFGNILVDGDNTLNVGSNGQALAKIYAHEGNFQSIVVHSNSAGSIGENNKPFATIYGTNIYGSTKIGVGTTSANMPLHINTGSATSVYSAGTQNGVLITADTYPSLVLENTGGMNGYKNLAIQNQDSCLHIGFQTDDGSGWTKQSQYKFDIYSENFWCKSNILPPSGSYNLGTAMNNWNQGHFNVVYTGSGTVSVSDRNKKKDIVDLDNALDTVMKLKPVSYKFINGTSGRTHTGFIAQDCENLVCDNWAGFVKHEDNYGLRYEEFIALNSRAIQELNERLVKLEKRDSVREAKVVGNSVIDTDWDPSRRDLVQIYERLDHLENQPASKPQLHRCVEISRINELYDRVSALESNESKGSSQSENFELVHSLMEKNHCLEMKVDELERKLNSLPQSESKNEIEDSDAGGLSLIESLQERLYKAEQQSIKQEKMIKKLTVALNKLIKQNE